jgi:hypothetical protein
MNSEISGAIAGPPVFVTLATGLMIAFAVQLLVTVLGVAIGMTVLSLRPKRSPATPEIERTGSSPAGKIGFAIGLGALLTVNLVLFVACFMAVKLSVVSNVLLGAILGVVIWSGYCLILTWISAKLLGSLVGTIASTLTAGVQGLIGMVMSAFGRKSRDREEPESIHDRLEATDWKTAQICRPSSDSNCFSKCSLPAARSVACRVAGPCGHPPRRKRSPKLSRTSCVRAIGKISTLVAFSALCNGYFRRHREDLSRSGSSFPTGIGRHWSRS